MAANPKQKKHGGFTPAERMCPKCGVRMANHTDRFSCGKCGLTEWKKA